jgi:hypothetical protein
MSSFVIICEVAERVAQPSTGAEVQKVISNDQHRRQGRFSARGVELARGWHLGTLAASQNARVSQILTLTGRLS